MRRLTWLRRTSLFGAPLAFVAAVGFAKWATAADHLDSPLVADDAGADIADVYSFINPNKPDKLILAMTLHGFVPPNESNISVFDPDVLYQFKIDNDGDAVEDLVIQAYVTERSRGWGWKNRHRGRQVMRFRGPVVPEVTGNLAQLVGTHDDARVRVSRTGRKRVGRGHDLRVFAGVRDDPFFFDVGQFNAILAGEATSFNNPGMDGFAGFNAYAIVVEVPIDKLGDNPNIGVWGTTSRR